MSLKPSGTPISRFVASVVGNLTCLICPQPYHDLEDEPTAAPLDPSFFDFDIGEPLTKEELKGITSSNLLFMFPIHYVFLQCVYMKKLQGQKMMIEHLYFFRNTHSLISHIFFGCNLIFISRVN